MKASPTGGPQGEEILELARSYQAACVLAAAAELDLFSLLMPGPLAAEEVAHRLAADRRGTRILLDALVALRLLSRRGERYGLPDGLSELLGREGPASVLAMVQHQATCLRRWSQLAGVVKSGCPPPRWPSVRGEAGDLEAFIEAMHVVSAPVAREVVGSLEPLAFRHLLDLGGASGSWTLAFLERVPAARATLVDRPEVLPLAARRLAAEGAADRVGLVAGDYLADDMPPGADLAWVSAIVHQHSRAENRGIFTRVAQALTPGGTLLIRDVVMEPDRVSPPAGALFAVNMLVGTEGGGTYTFDELRQDLEATGFVKVELRREDPGMNSVIAARKPGPP